MKSKQYIKSIISRKVLYTTITGLLFGGVAFAADYQNYEKIPGFERTSDFVEYLSNLYKLGISIAAILALFMIARGAFMYIVGSAGNAGKAGDGKGMIQDALFGLAIAMIIYITLFLINPDLVGGTLSSVKRLDDLAGRKSDSTTYTAGTCDPVMDNSSPCSVQNLTGTCFGSNAEDASRICMAESGGIVNKASGPDTCRNDPEHRSFSWGLFQINLTVHEMGGLNCPGAFTARNFDCAIRSEGLYSQCVNSATNASANIAKACEISNNGSNWNAWSTHTQCGL